MSKAVRGGLRSGTTFGIIIIFLALIGFTVIASTLIAQIFGVYIAPDQMPPVGFLVAFLALLGIWNGAQAAKPASQADTLQSALTAGLSAGAFCGLLVAIYVLIIGFIYEQGIDPRTYLSAVSPDSMRLLLFNQTPVPAMLLHLLLQALSGLAGGYLAYILRHSNWRAALADRTQGVRNTITRAAEQFRRRPYAVYVLFGVLALLLILMPQVWGSYWNYIIGTIAIYVIMGIGLNIIVGLAGQLVLGYVAFFAIGAYGIALFTSPQPLNLQWGFWPALLAGVLLAALTGVLLGLPILRLRGDYLAIVTLGFGEIIRIMLRSDLLTAFTGGPRGVRDIEGPSLFGLSLASDTNFLYLILVAMVLIIFIAYRLENSRTGRAWLAIREDEVAAQATGINTFQSKLLSLAIGAAFAGLAGVLFASRNQFTGPEDHTLMVSINVLALMIVGGMGSIPGIILGAFALKGLPEILRELENYRLMVFGALLVVMMILRPEGLWPGSRPKIEKADLPEQSAPEKEISVDIEGAQHASEP